MKKKTIGVCMGSSCFSRGNRDNLLIIQNYMESHHLETEIELKGCLCTSHCNKGPNIWLNEDLHNNVETELLGDMLDEFFSDNNK